MFKDEGLNAIICDNFIDPHFLSFMEYSAADKYRFMRIDADINGALKSGEGADDSVIIDIFKTALSDDKLTIKTEELKNKEVPAIITVDEYMRRYSEIGQFYGMSDGEIAKTVIVNTANPVVEKLKTLDGEKRDFVANYIYTLALSAYKKLSPEELDKLQKDSLKLLSYYID